MCEYRHQDKVEAVLAAARCIHRAEELLRPFQRYEQAKGDIRAALLRSGDRRAVALFDAIVKGEDDPEGRRLKEALHGLMCCLTIEQDYRQEDGFLTPISEPVVCLRQEDMGFGLNLSAYRRAEVALGEQSLRGEG